MSIRTAGGGGYDDQRERARDAVKQDIAEGYTAHARAENDYA